MKVSNAVQLSISYNPEFFNSSDFRFGTRRSARFECWDSDITNESGVAASLTDIQTLYEESSFTNWSINGFVFDNAQLTSFEILEGDWVAGVRYSFELLEFLGSDTDINKPDGDYYRGLDFKKSAKFLESFSENFSFDLSPNSRSYSHSVSFKFSKAIDSDPSLAAGKKNTQLDKAREIAKDLLIGASRPPFGFDNNPDLNEMYQDFGVSYKRFMTEAYDLQNKTVSFIERFTMLNDDGDTAHFITRNHVINLNENGVADVIENSELDFKKLAQPSLGSMITITDAEIQEARADRLQAVWDGYKPIIIASFDLPAGCQLKDLVLDDDGLPTLITNSRRYDPSSYKSSYSIVATNDPERGKVKHEYKITVSAVGLYYRASEQGSLTGTDVKIRLGKNEDGVNQQFFPAYRDALARYIEIYNDEDISNRVKGALNTFANAMTENNPGNTGFQRASSKPVKSQESFAEVQGTVSYEQVYSTEPKYALMNQAKSVEVNVAKRRKRHRKVTEELVDSYNILDTNPGGEILQNLGGEESFYSLPQTTNEIRVIGYRDSSVEQMLDTAISAIDPGEIYLEDCSYEGGELNETYINLSFSWR